MSSVVEWVAQNGDVIKTVLSSGLVLALLGGGVRLVRRGWNEYHGRGRAVLVRQSSSRLVDWIEQVQERVFPSDECDPRGVLGKRIDRSRFSWWGRTKSDAAMIAIVYLKGRTPVAYLSAEYFRQTGGIFFWYIVSLRDKKYKDALADMSIKWDQIESVHDNIGAELIEKLLRVCARGKQPWRYVVAEVDAADADLARKKVGAFQRAASEVIHRWRDDWATWLLAIGKPKLDPNMPRVFKIDVPFAMPLHDVDLLAEAAAHESPGWLLFAPRSVDAYRTGGGYEINGQEIRESVLDTLRRSYSTGSNEAYDAYIAHFYARLGAAVPDRVQMIHNRAVMAKPEAVEPAVKEGAMG